MKIIHPTTIKYILEQKYRKKRSGLSIYKDISDRVSYGSVVQIINRPHLYIDSEDIQYIMDHKSRKKGEIS